MGRWWVVAGAAAGAFLTLLALVAAGWGPLADLDREVSQALRGYGRSWPEVVSAARWITHAGALLPFLGNGLVVAGLLAVLRRRSAARLVGAVALAVPALWLVMQWALPRPRPAGGVVLITASGFPSGHSANAAAAGLLAVVLCWPHLGRWGRALLGAAATGFAVLIGGTRLVLLVHWPSDVLGGWLLAVAVVAAFAGLLPPASGAQATVSAGGSSGTRPPDRSR